MGLLLLQAPAEEPITLAEVKGHCRVDGTDDDALIGALITAARELAEHLTGRAFVTQRWTATLDSFPVSAISIPMPPLQSVQAITYLDADGEEQTLDDSAYSVHTSTLIGLVAPAYGTTWPATRGIPESVRVSFTAGYGTAAAVPRAIRQWMLLCVGGWYAQRESVGAGSFAELPRGVWDCLLDPYRIFRVA